VLYAIVGTAVIGVGALDELLSLRAAFATVAVAVLLVALATAAWHAAGRRPEPRRRPATAS
jgi:membrane protein implicated in regulation of membrane protease activity